MTPNDGLCHMDEKGVYTHSSLLDYPSVSQINHKVAEGLYNCTYTVSVHFTACIFNHTFLIVGRYGD